LTVGELKRVNTGFHDKVIEIIMQIGAFKRMYKLAEVDLTLIVAEDVAVIGFKWPNQ
jgi:hypothetical protein